MWGPILRNMVQASLDGVVDQGRSYVGIIFLEMTNFLLTLTTLLQNVF